MATEPLILAVVSEPDSWRGVHYERVRHRLPRGRMVHFDAWRSPLAERGLSFRQHQGRTIVTLGQDEICPDAIWWWQPIPRERDGLVSAAVGRLIDPSELILADAVRQTMEPLALEVLGDLAHRAVVRHIEALETAFPEDRYVNPPAANRRAGNKPYNLQVAVDHGFLVPEDALFAPDPRMARAWVREQFRRGRRVLWKFAVNAGFVGKDGRLHKVPATELRREDEPDFPYEMVRHMPLIFETVVPGKRDLRVVVVGHEVFPAQIIPTCEVVTLDPRVGEHRYEPYPLSSAFERMCVEYIESLGLRYGVIDFRLTPDDQKVFLEAQGDGTFAEVEEHTEQDVSGALARQLLAVAAPR